MTGAGEPGGGVEVMMQKHLVGTPGKQTFEQGRDGTIIPVGESSLVPAVDGNDVTLTVNSSLQWYAQNALAQRIKETKAKSGTVVIEDVKTGNLLAVASYPSFDPNTDIGKKGTQLSNVAFSDVFEPGSTSKIMTMAAALEEGDGHALDAGRHPQPPAALRRELQGQPRARHRVPHGGRHPGRVEQHRHDPGQRDDEVQDPRVVLPQVRARLAVRHRVPG